MDTRFDKDNIERLAKLVTEKRRFVISCHMSPDGDALGSSLALERVIRLANPRADVVVVSPDEPTRTLAFLPGYSDIAVFTRYPDKVKKMMDHADVVFSLDYNALSRIDLVAPTVRDSKAVKVQIDHHLDPEPFADVMFSYPEKPATCMLLYQVLTAAGLDKYIDSTVAECLLAGMMTDTGDFTYNIKDPDTYTVVGELIKAGADKARLTRLLFNTFSESCLRIQGFALSQRMQVFNDMHAALITLSRDELNEWGYKRGDTEGLVNKPLSIPGILYVAYLRQEENYIKVSMRSLGNFPVNELCNDHFNGGGHLNAAGGEFYGTLDQCADKFRSLLKINKEKYIDNDAVLQGLLSEELHKK